MQTFSDPKSPRSQLTFEQLPRGVVSFPAHIVDAVKRQQLALGTDNFTDAYARKSLEDQTLLWYYEGLPVAFKSLPDGIDVLGVGWEETAEYPTPLNPSIKVVQP